MKNYKQFIITTIPFLPELVSGILWELEITGINELDNGLHVFSDESEKVTKQKIDELLGKLVEQNLIESYSVIEEIHEEINWNEEWERKININHITNRIVIKPSFKDYSPKENEIVITIDPKMSFGTGEHQTTKLMLILLEKFVNKGCKVLDVGSGTGILAIASILFGAENALGIDNDEWCLENGIENVSLNKLKNKIEIRLSEIQKIKEIDFDLIAANINKNILLNIAGELKKRIKKAGIVIISGLLIEDKNDILKEYKKYGFNLLEEQTLDEWSALVLKN